MYKSFFKRLFDILISLSLLLVIWPVLLIIALLVKLDSPGPVVFKQQRLGKGGKVFDIYKYRSMCVNAESQGTGVYSLKGDPRVTKIGKILRATSLDELLQIFNVLKGDMSFIGPRPPLTYHPWTIDKYTDEQFRMFELRPGLTGWAQVNGRKDVEWNKRIVLNVFYVDNVSLFLDVKIVFLTIAAVLKNKDNENTQATVKGEQTEKEEVTK